MSSGTSPKKTRENEEEEVTSEPMTPTSPLPLPKVTIGEFTASDTQKVKIPSVRSATSPKINARKTPAMSSMSPVKTEKKLSAEDEEKRKSLLVDEFYDGTIAIEESKTKTEPGSGKKYTMFVITVKLTCGLSWTVEHRYNDFYKLNQSLKNQLNTIKELKFPPKIWFGNLARATVENRRQRLEAYLAALMNFRPRPMLLHGFLEFEEHTKSMDRTNGKVSVEDFELLKVVGKGSFGKVFLVRFLRNDKVYAMKVLRKTMVKRRKQVEHTRAERRIMGAINYPFIVKLRYAFQTSTNLYFVTDYMKGGELFFHLKRKRTFNEGITRFYAAELVLALSHLHSQNVVYRDLKPENILLDERGHIQITDFGLSKDNVSEPTGATTFCGTPEYLAPETILTRHKKTGYGQPVDWWSFGTLVFEMLTGWPPFYHKNIKTMCERILKAPLVFPERPKVSSEAKDMIRQLLRRDPAKRIKSEALKNHPFFAKIDWDKLEKKQVTPPFVPVTSHSEDVRYFDTTFTREIPTLPLGRPPDSNRKDDDFDNFTFEGDDETPTDNASSLANAWAFESSDMGSVKGR